MCENIDGDSNGLLVDLTTRQPSIFVAWIESFGDDISHPSDWVGPEYPEDSGFTPDRLDPEDVGEIIGFTISADGTRIHVEYLYDRGNSQWDTSWGYFPDQYCRFDGNQNFICTDWEAYEISLSTEGLPVNIPEIEGRTRILDWEFDGRSNTMTNTDIVQE